MVIKAITVLENPIEGLESRLQKGLKMDVDAPIVLLVGPNGSGKSAFLRLLKTSYDHKTEFDRTGKSKVLDYHKLPDLEDDYNFKKYRPELAKTNKVISKWDEKYLQYFINRYNFQDAPQVQEISFRVPEHFGQDYKWIEAEDVTKRYINAKEFNDFIKRVKDAVNQDTEQNKWMFLKPEFDIPVYYLCFVPLKQGASSEGAETDSHKTIVHFNYIQSATFANRDKSTGQILINEFELLKNRIHNFFQEGLIATYVEKAYEEYNQFFAASRVIDKYSDPHCPEAREELRKAWIETHEHNNPIRKGDKGKSNLVVFMDEPTRSLSYDNLYLFRRDLVNLTKQYAERIQFFIATNDPVLIEKTDAKYINFYKQPIESTNKIDLESTL